MLFLNRYESIGVIGRGSMGEVHAARSIHHPAEVVVVKVMRRELADTPRARQFFEREMTNSMRLNHPYIVRVFEVGVGEHGPCIVMEMITGQSLEASLRLQPRWSLERTALMLGFLCHALDSAHRGAVIHRDLKPANLMLLNPNQDDETLKVMDFGLAHLASKPYLSKERLSGVEVVRAQGTPAYIAPEQLRGDDVDVRTDFYSVGVILFEVLTGRLPFQDQTMDALIDAHLRRSPPKFAQLGITNLPPAVEAVVQRCMAKYPSERPANAIELATEFSYAIDADIWASTEPPEPVDIAPAPVAAQPTTQHDPHAIVYQCEAWMPDRIAVIKISGFLHDTGGEVLASEPGLIQAKFVPQAKAGLFDKWWGAKPAPKSGIFVDIQLDKPNPMESRLVVTSVFRVSAGTSSEESAMTTRCHKIGHELRQYLMAGG